MPWAVTQGDTPLIVESIAANRLHFRGPETFRTAIKFGLEAIVNEPGYLDVKGRTVLCNPLTRIARDFIEAMVTRRGGRLKKLSGRVGFRVKIKKRLRRRLALIFMAADALIAVIKEMGLFEGQNPFLLDGWEDLDETRQTELKALFRKAWSPLRRFVADVGRYYRFPFDVWIPVRTDDVRWFDAIVERMKRCPHMAVQLYIMIVGTTGCRGGEPQWFTFADWCRNAVGGDPFGVRGMFRNKGDDGDPEKEVLFTRRLCAMIEHYVDTVRRALDPLGRGMGEFRELARRAAAGDEEAEGELASSPILLNSEGKRLTYPVVWYHMSRHIDRSEIPATLHWTRHEYVFTRMRTIEAIPDPILQKREREDLCAYMGWSPASGELMLEGYDAYEKKRRVRESGGKFAEARDAAAGAFATVVVEQVKQSTAPALVSFLGAANFAVPA